MDQRKTIRSKWEALISAYESSNITQKEFARAHRIKICTLRYWLYKLRIERRKERGAQVDFVEISTHRELAGPTFDEAVTKGCRIGVGSAVVELDELPDPRWLAALFYAMEKLQ